MGKIEAASVAAAPANIRGPRRHPASRPVQPHPLVSGRSDPRTTGAPPRSDRRPEPNVAKKRLWAARYSPARPMVRRARSRTVGLAASARQAARDRAPRHVEGPIVPLSPQQFLVRPGFADAAVPKDDDRRLRWNRVVPMRGEDDDPVLEFGEELEDGALTLRVEARDRLVQDHDRGILVDEPR